MSNQAEDQNQPTPSAEPAAAPAAGDGAQAGQEGSAGSPGGSPKPTESGQGGLPTAIPYDRFREKVHENQQLRQQLALLQQQGQQPKQPANEDPEPNEGQFDSVVEYLKARQDWAVRQGTKQARTQWEQEQQQREAYNRQFQREATAREQFTRKAIEASSKDPAMAQAIQTSPVWDIPMHRETQLALLESDQAVELLRHFTANPAEALELAQLDPIRAAKQIARLEVKLAGSGQPTKKVSDFPKPMTPVGSGKSGAKQEYSDGMSQEDFNHSFPPIW